MRFPSPFSRRRSSLARLRRRIILAKARQPLADCSRAAAAARARAGGAGRRWAGGAVVSRVRPVVDIEEDRVIWVRESDLGQAVREGGATWISEGGQLRYNPGSSLGAVGGA